MKRKLGNAMKMRIKLGKDFDAANGLTGRGRPALTAGDWIGRLYAGGVGKEEGEDDTIYGPREYIRAVCEAVALGATAEQIGKVNGLATIVVPEDTYARIAGVMGAAACAVVRAVFAAARQAPAAARQAPAAAKKKLAAQG